MYFLFDMARLACYNLQVPKVLRKCQGSCQASLKVLVKVLRSRYRCEALEFSSAATKVSFRNDCVYLTYR